MPKKATICESLKSTLEKLVAEASSKTISKTLRNHISSNYLKKQKAAKFLQPAIFTLKFLLADTQIENEGALKVSAFKRSFKIHQDLLAERKPPKHEEEGQDFNVTYRVSRVNNGKIYKYDNNVVTKGGSLLRIGERFILSTKVFDELKKRDDQLYKEDYDKYQELLRQAKLDCLTTRIKRDLGVWHTFMAALRDDCPDSYRNIENMGSYAAVIDVLHVEPHISNPTFERFESRVVTHSSIEKYINNKYIIYEVKVNPSESQSDLNPYGDSDVFKGHIDWQSHSKCPLYPELKESCLPKILINTYKESFDNYHMKLKGERKDIRLDMDYISRVCRGKPYTPGEEMPLTINELSMFFEKFHLGIRIFNPEGILIYQYIPEDETFHTAIRPRVTVIMYKNNHATRITQPKEFQERMSRSIPELLRPMSNEFNIKPQSNDDDGMGSCKIFRVTHIANNMDELCGFIDKIKDVPKDTSKIIANVIYNANTADGNLTDLAFKMITKGFTPMLKGLRNSITLISLTNLKLEFSDTRVDLFIKTASKSTGYEEVSVNCVEDYMKFSRLQNEIYSSLINNDHLSHYSDGVGAILNKYYIHTPVGVIPGQSVEFMDPFTCNITRPSDMIEIDVYKQYSTCLWKAKNIPSISPFDDFQLYKKGTPLSEDCMYLVDIEKGEDPVYNVESRTLMFYEELSHLDPKYVKYSIHSFMKLILHPNDKLPKMIEDLYYENSDVPIELRKSIMNTVIGTCGKKRQQHVMTTAFKNKDDAEICVEMLKEEKRKREECGHAETIKIYGAQPMEPFLIERVKDTNIYTVSSQQEVDLISGFLPINYMVRSMARMQMSQFYRKLSDIQNVTVKAFKTDAIYFTINGGLERAKNIPFIKKMIGEYLGGVRINNATPKVDSDMRFHEPPELNVKSLLKKRLPQVVPQGLPEIRAHRTMLVGSGGSGKTFNLMNYCRAKFGDEHLLVVTAWNSQAASIQKTYKGVKAITYHYLRGSKIDDKTVKGAAYDVSNVKCIIIEEIMLLEHKKLVKLWKYMHEHSDIAFYATGDHHQLEAIGDDIDGDYKMDLLMSEVLFPRVIKLKTNYRLKKEEDRKRIAEIEDSMDRWKGSWVDFALLHFPDQWIGLDELKAKGVGYAMAYFNSSVFTLNDVINKYVQHTNRNGDRTKTLYNLLTYHQYDDLICKMRMTTEKGTKLYPNYTYKIHSMTNEEFRLFDVMHGSVYDVGIDKCIRVTHEQVVKNFTLGYANTVHASQGSKIDCTYVVADTQNKHMTKNWLYSAITRATDLGKIYFLKNNLKVINDENVRKQMVLSYKHQDRKANRPFNEADYITADWIETKYNHCSHCKYCGDYMSYEKRNPHKVTVNRLRNTEAHLKVNCELCCHACNTALPRK